MTFVARCHANTRVMSILSFNSWQESKKKYTSRNTRLLSMSRVHAKYLVEMSQELGLFPQRSPAHTPQQKAVTCLISCAEIPEPLAFHSVLIFSYLCQLSQASFFLSQPLTAEPDISHWGKKGVAVGYFSFCLPGRFF